MHNDRILAGEVPTEASTVESVGTVGCEAGFDGRSQQLMMALPVQDCCGCIGGGHLKQFLRFSQMSGAGWVAGTVATLMRKS